MVPATSLEVVGNAGTEAVGDVAVNHRAILDFLGEGADRAFSVDAELFGDAVVADQTEVRKASIALMTLNMLGGTDFLSKMSTFKCSAAFHFAILES